MRAFLIALVILGSSCQTSGMSFTRDARLTIESPGARAILNLPVELRWKPSPSLQASMQRSNGDQYYGVFVDRAPVRAGNDISAMVDSECKRTPGCGTEQWFNDRGVYFTHDTSVMIADVQDLRNDRAREDKDLHQATVVVMRRAEKRVLSAVIDGTRNGEGAESVEFWVHRTKS